MRVKPEPLIGVHNRGDMGAVPAFLAPYREHIIEGKDLAVPLHLIQDLPQPSQEHFRKADLMDPLAQKQPWGHEQGLGTGGMPVGETAFPVQAEDQIRDGIHQGAQIGLTTL